jgi:hypothetical protein
MSPVDNVPYAFKSSTLRAFKSSISLRYAFMQDSMDECHHYVFIYLLKIVDLGVTDV